MTVKKNNTNKNDIRTRNWTFLVYPESAPENWREIIGDNHIPWIESPLHDKDVTPDGEMKKAHWHVLVMFSGKKSYAQVEELTQRINSPVPKVCANAKGLVRYFAHMDDPDKYQYSKNDIVSHGGADISKFLTVTGGDRLRILADIQDWIDETNCTEFARLAEFSRQEHFDDWYEVVTQKSTLFLNTYLRSKRHSGK